jgi:hypothetical protein
LYPILNRTIPWWDTYPLAPETEQRQRTMIEELEVKKVNWVILGNFALDGQEKLRFMNTHQLIYQYFMNNYEEVILSGLPNDYHLLFKGSKSVSLSQYFETTIPINDIHYVDCEIHLSENGNYEIRNTGMHPQILINFPIIKQIKYVSLEFGNLPDQVIPGQFFWTTDTDSTLNENKSVRFNLISKRKEYLIYFNNKNNIGTIRIDLGGTNSLFTLKMIKVFAEK